MASNQKPDVHLFQEDDPVPACRQKVFAASYSRRGFLKAHPLNYGSANIPLGQELPLRSIALSQSELLTDPSIPSCKFQRIFPSLLLSFKFDY
jgi:hypothetical protein